MAPDPKKPRYLFDINNFDEPDAPEPEPVDLPPPPPSFSLEELIEAREASFEDGKVDGLERARVSREQYIAEQIQNIKTQFETLVSAEQSREAVFEKEVVSLCREIFAKTFPELNRREGLNEVISVIHGVLQNNSSPSVIQVLVPADEVEEVSARLQVLAGMIDGFAPSRLSVEAGSDLERGSCRMRWKDGSAQRDHKQIAEAVLKALDKTIDQALAQNPIKGQDTE